MSEPPKLSELATGRMHAEVRLVLQRALLDLAKQVRKDPSFMAYMPPEVWNERVDSVGVDVVNVALNIAWRDWNHE
jgi:hypothetical protein